MSASAGRVLMIPKGTYDPTVTYEKLDLVSYLGGSYVCKQTTTGNLPTNTTYWQNMVDIADMTGASAGAAGIHGLVPAPAAGDQAKFLRGDATWAELDLSAKADQSIIGGSYNASTAYEKGDRFSYNGVRYKVIIESGTVTGVTPPNATYYEECSVDDDISSLNSSSTATVTLASGVTAYADNYIVKKGNVVTVSIGGVKSFANGRNSLGYIPEGYRPHVLFHGYAQDYTNDRLCMCNIATNGEISIYKTDLNPNMTIICLSCTYVVD